MNIKNSKIVFKTDKPTDVVIYGDRLSDHSNSENCVFIYDDQVTIKLKLSDSEERYFHTQGYLSILKLEEMNDAIDKTDPRQFPIMDNYEDYGDDDDIDVWDLGVMMIENFVGEIKYNGQIWGTGNCDDFNYWNGIDWNYNDLNNAKLTIPVNCERIEQLPTRMLKKMRDKWWSQ